jgi:Rrf2 family protein
MFQIGTEICLHSLALLLSRPRGEIVQSRQIAEHLGISATYVTKALQPLARRGWLRSVQGRSGGWLLTVDPTSLTLRQIIEALEPDLGWRRCVIGHAVCSDETSCPFHDVWKRTLAKIEALMASTQLDALADFLPPSIHHRPWRNGPAGGGEARSARPARSGRGRRRG